MTRLQPSLLCLTVALSAGLLLLQSYSDKPVKARVRIPAGLGKVLQDVETHRRIAATPDGVAIDLPGDYGTRMFLVAPAAGDLPKDAPQP